MKVKISYKTLYQDGYAGMVDIPAECNVRYTRIEKRVLWDKDSVPQEVSEEMLRLALQRELKETLVRGTNSCEFVIAADIRNVNAYEFVCVDGCVALLPCIVKVAFSYEGKPVQIDARDCRYVKEAGVFVTGGVRMYRLSF
jgi:hypothetical protein